MKPAPFSYLAPTSIDEVVAALVEHGDEAKVLAGGQSLLPMMNLRLARPSVLVDVGRVASLSAVDGELVGAGVTVTALASSSHPLVREVVPLIAHEAIRNRGTIGGSLAHADPAAELPAVALLVDATMVVAGPAGTREVPAADFFVSYLETALAVDEVLVGVRLPAVPADTGFAFQEVSRRHGDFALVGCGARVTVDDAGDVVDERLVFIGVDGTPVVSDVASLDPPDDIHATGRYRKHVAGVLADRVRAVARRRARA